MQDYDAKTRYKPMCAPRGKTLSCKGWAQEAAMRMLMNSLDPEVAEAEQDLVLYGGHYKAARNLACFNAIVASLRELEDDQTLVVHAGKPIGVFKTSVRAPRLIIANAFPDLDLAMAPNLPSVPHPPENAEQPATGSWMYVGTQSVLQDTFEIFAALARQYFAGSLAGRLVVGGGMGALGGAQALAASLHGAAFLGIDPDPARIKRRLKTGYCDVMVNDLDEALRILKNAVRKREAASVALIGNCAAVIPEFALRGVVPDLLTSQIINPDAGVAAESGWIYPAKSQCRAGHRLAATRSARVSRAGARFHCGARARSSGSCASWARLRSSLRMASSRSRINTGCAMLSTYLHSFPEKAHSRANPYSTRYSTPDSTSYSIMMIAHRPRGRRFPVSPQTSRASIACCWKCFQTTATCNDGSRSLAGTSGSRVCPHARAGLHALSLPNSRGHSLGWS